MFATLVKLARPKQWAKNVLVFAAPGAAGVLTHGAPLLRTLAAFVAFCFAATGTYAWNDALDVEADRAHPTKCNRPIATGAISVPAAQLFGNVCLALAIVIGFLVNTNLGVTIAVYVALTLAYTVRLKHELVLDLVAVAAGFVLRTVAGGAAAEVRISTWFLIVAGAGSLFIVTGKRGAEVALLGAEAGGHRKTLSGYSNSYLLYVRAVSSTVAVLGYCLWAFQYSHQAGKASWFEISIVPFVIAILRYALLLDQGEGGAPEDVLLEDPVLLIAGIAWIAIFAGAVYLT